MCAVVRPEDVEAFLAVCRKWDVLATVIGEVTDGDRLVDHLARRDGGGRAAAHRRARRPGLPAAGACGTTPARTRWSPTRPTACPGPPRRTSCARRSCGWPPRRTCAAGRGSPTSTTGTCAATPCSAQPADAGVVRVDEETGRGVAVATDCNARFVALDPYTGTQLALAEAYRNVATSGAVPLAVTNCLNFGSPEDPHVMWQFAQAVRGLADGCAALGIPVTGGNVSFYNQTGSTAILPTPVVGVLGVLDDVARRVRSGFVADGDARPAAGRRPATSSAAASGRTSCTATSAAGRPRWTWPPSGGSPACSPRRRPTGCSTGAHDLSDGGLAQALVEACLVGGVRRDGGAARRSTRSSRCSPSRPGGCWSTVAPADVDAVLGAGPRGGGARGARWAPPAARALAIADVGELGLTSCARPGRARCRRCSRPSAVIRRCAVRR